MIEGSNVENFFSGMLASHYNWWAFVILMMIGLYAMIAKNNLVKKIIGMNIFQTAIILFYVSIGVKRGATLPIIEHGPGHGGEEAAHGAAEALTHGAEAVAAHTDAAMAHANATTAAADMVEHGAHAAEHAVHAADYLNPLPHVLMLTAIVVSVATLGVALALALNLYRRHNTLEEDEILENLRTS